MRFQGALDIAAPRERVWQFVTDPLAVSVCAPDVQSVDVIDPKQFKIVVRAGVGPIRATFNLDVVFSELTAPERASVRARGQAPGSAVEMLSTMDLVEHGPERTTLRWASDVTVTGTIAQVGARLMQGTADKITQQVFTCIKSKLEAPAATGG
ncbi:MAG TPA: carbon monoxide dehydrogenase subunit G [Candidatus Limnocylindria bacterium]|nr:carbon monoxide dehydrogenase subunit G [Candidatus Limnocylindria bacterium]